MHNWRNDIKRQLLVWGTVVLSGYLLGQLLLVTLVALLLYCGRNYYQLYRLAHWLSKDPETRPADPPESFGIWGEIFDGIYRLQKQERRSSAYLESIINKAQESSAALEIAVVMINKQDNLDWWNLAAEKLLGLQYPQDKNQSITNLIRNPRFHDYFYGENYADTLTMDAPGDAGKMLEFQIALFGEHERLMLVRDITQLQRLARMRKDFVANVSHELGTPITVIKGYLEAIIDNKENLDEKWHKPVQQMRQQSQRMENIVRDLLMLSSLETKAVTRTKDTTSISALIGEIENDTRQIFIDKSHTFEFSCQDEVKILGKRNELYSAISNLVMNAAKYTPSRGLIKVTAKFTDTAYIVEVRDNGIGIEAEHIPRLTERFYRVDVSRSSESGGTGLGLAIVKHILARHEAELHIESELGKGSRFVCEFPLYRVRAAEQSVTAGNEGHQNYHPNSASVS